MGMLRGHSQDNVRVRAANSRDEALRRAVDDLRRGRLATVATYIRVAALF